MNCCINCFADHGLQSRIKAMAKEEGACDFCSSDQVNIITCEQLSESFSPIFELYQNHPTAKLSLKEDQPSLMHQHLTSYWPKLFSEIHLKPRDVKQLVNQIGRGWDGFQEDLFEKAVELIIYLGDEGIDESLNTQWEKFAVEIKERNRFFIEDSLDLEILESNLERFSKTYQAGSVFYRARISDRALAADQLGKPPATATSPGRANPVGIPYLYVSDTEETTLYETRVSLHESISIGKFILNAPLQVISLKDIAYYGPFEIQDLGFDLEEFMRIRPYFLKLEQELSKPVRKQDVNINYLPTQYLCEFIKFSGFHAVEYRSAMKESGYNLAVFNDDKLICQSTKHYQVNGLVYDWE